MIVLSVCKCILLLLVLPFFIGGLSLTFLPLYKQTVTVTFLTGYLISFAAFILIAIPCELMIRYNAFGYCVSIYAVTLLVLAAAGAWRMFLRVRHTGWRDIFPGDHYPSPEELMNPRRDITRYRERYSKESLLYWALFAVLLCLQLYMAVSRASFDGDDAYYVVESVQADQIGTMNTTEPYTGLSTTLDIRHALAVITMWEAFIARMTGLHAAVVAHTVMPLLFLPLTYLVYAEIGVILLRGKHNRLPVFMLLIGLFQMFGNVSIYTNETFLMTRTWQGKSVMANLVVPLIFWVYCHLFEDAKNSGKEQGRREKYSPFLLLTMINMFAGVCTSMGVLLSAALIGTLTLFLLLYVRKLRILPLTVLSCIPNAVYVVLYWGLLPDLFK